MTVNRRRSSPGTGLTVIRCSAARTARRRGSRRSTIRSGPGCAAESRRSPAGVGEGPAREAGERPRHPPGPQGAGARQPGDGGDADAQARGIRLVVLRGADRFGAERRPGAARPGAGTARVPSPLGACGAWSGRTPRSCRPWTPRDPRPSVCSPNNAAATTEAEARARFEAHHADYKMPVRYVIDYLAVSPPFTDSVEDLQARAEGGLREEQGHVPAARAGARAPHPGLATRRVARRRRQGQGARDLSTAPSRTAPASPIWRSASPMIPPPPPAAAI